MTQVVKHLPNKYKALSSNHNTAKNNTQEKEYVHSKLLHGIKAERPGKIIPHIPTPQGALAGG
jgi:hypothetical protein